MTADKNIIQLVSSIFEEQRNGVLYRPRLVKEVGGVTSAILLQQMIYWWKNSNYKSFYKFKQPCQHTLYREGDSWCEELAFSRCEFDTALGRIAVKKTAEMSIREALAESSKQHKPVIYWIDAGRVTHYNINEEVLTAILESAYLKQETSDSKSKKSALAKAGNSLLVEQESNFTNSETTREYPKTTKAKAEKTLERSYLGDVLDFEKKRQGKRSWTVPPEAGGEDSFAGEPVDAFCEVLAKMSPDRLPDKKREAWAQQLRRIADEWRATASEMVEAIRAIPKSDIGWKTYKTPFTKSFGDDIGPLLTTGGNGNGAVLKLSR